MSRLAAVLLVIAAVTYSVWLAEVFLPERLSWLHSYVSEYSAVGQPYRAVFRAADIVAGVCLVAVALVFRTSRLIVAGLVVLGIAVIADAVFALDCAGSLSTACRKRTYGFADHVHVAASALTGLSMVVALVGVQRVARRKLPARLAIALIVSAGVSIVVLDRLNDGQFAGVVLRLQLLTAAAGMVVAAVALFRGFSSRPVSALIGSGSTPRIRSQR